MDYGVLPPEINSGRMYTGPGAGPMLAAAQAWDELAAELHATASSYSSVISGLTSEGWMGPASASMAASAAPYVTWMTNTGAQAEQAAAQARAGVGAYEAAFSATVPPPVIAANRTQLASLVGTNILGQNTPAIAATEAHYGEMWAQDTGAMYGYAGASHSAATLTPFTEPPQTTNPAGAGNQALAAGQATGNAAVTNTQNTMSQLSSAMQGVTSGSSSGGLPTADLPSLKDAVGWGVYLPQNGSYLFSLVNSMNSLMRAAGGSGAAAAGASALAPALSSAMGSGSAGFAGLGSLGGGMTAGLGQAGSLGALSVPQTWAAVTPATSSIGSALGVTPLGATPGIGMNSGMMNGMPMLANAARGVSGGQTPTIPRFDMRPSIIPMSPAAG